MRKLFGHYKFIINNVAICFLALFVLVACFKNEASKEYNVEVGSIDEIIDFHKYMNEQHGKTNGYYASIALANADYDKAYGLYYRDCKAGIVIECLNAYYIGEERSLAHYNSAEFVSHLQKSIRKNIKACNSGVSFGCVNVFFAFESLNSEDDFIIDAVTPIIGSLNDESILNKSLNLTKQECEKDDAVSCFFYSRILRIVDNYADVSDFVEKGLDLGYVLSPFVRLPSQSPQTISYFKRSCSLNEGLSCRYLGYWYDKYEHDMNRAKEFYKKACDLGLTFSCDELRKPAKTQIDEVGAPTLKRR